MKEQKGITTMTNDNYITIPTHSNFEINDQMPPEYAIRSVDTHEYLKVYSSHKYLQVYFPKRLGGDGKVYLLHKIVAEAYLGKCPANKEVDHIDTCILNYNHKNLRYVTRKENNRNPLTLKHKSISNENRKKLVIQIDKDTGKSLALYFGVGEAARLLHIDRTGISMCINGRLKSYKGFCWSTQTL